MAEFYFIEDQTTLDIIQGVLDLAGPNFNPPYNTDQNLTDQVIKNEDVLVQFETPGGGKMQGNSPTAPNMGGAINTLLIVLAPLISAYAFILPILGVIRGIIEILCCLMNPFCVIKAVTRLFEKWLPPLISLFPPFAGIVIIASVIKVILALTFYVMTEIVPTVQLIIFNVKLLAEEILKGEFFSQDVVDSIKFKLTNIVQELANKTGILVLLKPILEIIFLILGLVSGFPCGGGKTSDCSRPDITGVDTGFSCDDADTPVDCPEVFRNPPAGQALVLPSFFGDSIPFFAWTVLALTGGENIPEIIPFMQSLKDQLNEQLDEAIDEATPVGGDGVGSHFLMRVISPTGLEFKAPIVKITGNLIHVISPLFIVVQGLVEYEIEPNLPMLVARNVIPIACHPDVEAAIDSLQERYESFEESALDRNPELIPVQDLYNEMIDDFNGELDTLSGLINGFPAFDEDGNPILAPDPDTGLGGIIIKDPDPDTGFDEDIVALNNVQNDIIDLLTDFTNDMTDRMSSLISRNIDLVNSNFDVDKTIVRAGGGKNKAIITVTPRDPTGSTITKNLPRGVNVSVDIFTDFGTLSNQQRNNEEGTVTAELTSAFPGVANIRARVNKDFISTFSGSTREVKELTVTFVADAALPKRRLVTKTGVNSKTSSTAGPERSPGGGNG